MSALDGRIIAVAGASGGLGPSVVRTLSRAGATVAAAEREQAHVDALGTELGLPAERWDGHGVDLLDLDATHAWAARLTERFGRVDGLVHLVGGWRGGTAIADGPYDDWALLHDLLVRTLQHTTHAFAPALQASGRGRFVLVSSLQAQHPSAGNAAYAAAKAAAETWTLTYAQELADSGATANVVVVNAILTPQMREAEPDKPFTTFTSAEDIAATIAFVCSDAAAKMNGQRVALHG